MHYFQDFVPTILRHGTFNKCSHRMLGFTVRTRPIGHGSPRSVGSPQLDSPISAGEIDTRAPFESVKAAVSLFKDVGSPRSSSLPIIKRSKAEEKVLDKETQHQMMLKELEYYKDQLRKAENEKARASKDLQKAKRTSEQLTNKLETLSESKQEAIKVTEAAKSKTKVLQEQKALRAQLGSDAWKADLNAEKERYKASAQELLVCKQEISTLRRDFDAALEAKFVAFQAAEEAHHVMQVNEEKQCELVKELDSLRETLDQVKLTSLRAEEEHEKLRAEKEALALKYGLSKEETEKEIRRLKQAFEPAENLEEKLEGTAEAVKVLQEQLYNVRTSDLSSLQSIVLELDIAKKTLKEVLEERDSIQSSVDTFKSQLEEAKTKRSESEMKAIEAETAVENMQADLVKAKSELESVISGDVAELQSTLEKLVAEGEKATHEAEETKRSIELTKQEAEEARIKAKEAEKNLQIVSTQVGAAKASEKLADEQVHNPPKLKDGEVRMIRLSVQEFESIKKKITQFGSEVEFKVAMAQAQVETINSNEHEVLQKVEAILKASKGVQTEVEETLKIAELADAVKKVVENELQKWREKEENKVGAISHSFKAR